MNLEFYLIDTVGSDGVEPTLDSRADGERRARRASDAHRGEGYAIIRHMKRTTIFIPEGLERDLQLYARRARKPAALVVREAITAYLARERTVPALPSFAGAFDSGHTDTAERHEELLFGGSASGPRKSSPPAKRPASRQTTRPARKRNAAAR